MADRLDLAVAVPETPGVVTATPQTAQVLAGFMSKAGGAYPPADMASVQRYPWMIEDDASARNR